jgi:electron transfer flavoprotein alpha subunit
LNVGLVSYCLKFNLGSDRVIQGVKESYGGKLYSTMACCGGRPHLFTFKSGSAGVGSPNKRRKADVVELPPLTIDAACHNMQTMEFIPADPRTVDLTEADMIFAGGSGVGTQEMFAVIQELADTMGASVGGTRPAVDQGWVPFERQIGQTGKIVSPRLYIAAGISGASLHAMGIKASENIVAINTDKSAPIFDLSHCSAVGDLTEVLPLLLKKIKDHQRMGAKEVNPA